MALLFMDGFDAGDAGPKWTSSSGGSSNTDTRFSTGRSWYMATSGDNVTRTIPASSQLFIGLALKFGTTPSGSARFLDIRSDTGTTTHLSLQFSSSTTLDILRGTSTVITSASVGAPLAWGAYIEVSATIADSGGTCVVKVNGTTVINFTGDTRNAGTSTNIDAISLGKFTGFTPALFIDDLYLCDSTGSAPYNTFLGEVRISTLSPNGAGSSTQFTPSSGANYTTVDELPYSTTDYVQDTTSGHRDTYTFSDVGSTTTIFGAQNSIIAKKTDVSSISLKPAVKSGATVYYGTTTALTTADSIIRNIHIVDPNTSAAWTQSGVNALEAGFEVA